MCHEMDSWLKKRLAFCGRVCFNHGHCCLWSSIATHENSHWILVKSFFVGVCCNRGSQFSLAVIMCIMHGQKKDIRVSCFAFACRNLPHIEEGTSWYQKESTDRHHLRHWESTIKAPRGKWPQTNPRWSSTNPPTSVSRYLCLSLTARQIKTVAKSGFRFAPVVKSMSLQHHQAQQQRTKTLTSGYFLLPAEVCTTGINCTCLLHVFFLFFFFGCLMVWCVALILLLVAKGGCLQKSDLLLCLYKAKFVMQDSEREGRAFVVPWGTVSGARPASRHHEGQQLALRDGHGTCKRSRTQIFH